jgi:MSHA pilin protein MshC
MALPADRNPTRTVNRPSRVPAARRLPAAGFTLVEMVIVMVVMAVIATIGMSRFADREPFAAQAVTDQLVSGLRLAQAMAVAQRRSVHVILAATPPVMSVCLDAACTQPLLTPAGDTQWLVDSSGLHLNAALSLSFGPDGSASNASTLTLQVLADGSSVAGQAITVESGSGYVHAP